MAWCCVPGFCCWDCIGFTLNIAFLIIWFWEKSFRAISSEWVWMRWNRFCPRSTCADTSDPKIDNRPYTVTPDSWSTWICFYRSFYVDCFVQSESDVCTSILSIDPMWAMRVTWRKLFNFAYFTFIIVKILSWDQIFGPWPISMLRSSSNIPMSDILQGLFFDAVQFKVVIGTKLTTVLTLSQVPCARIVLGSTSGSEATNSGTALNKCRWNISGTQLAAGDNHGRVTVCTVHESLSQPGAEQWTEFARSLTDLKHYDMEPDLRQEAWWLLPNNVCTCKPKTI